MHDAAKPDLRISYLEHRSMRADADRLTELVDAARPADVGRLEALAAWRPWPPGTPATRAPSTTTTTPRRPSSTRPCWSATRPSPRPTASSRASTRCWPTDSRWPGRA
jgi:hypothetical protein